MHESRTASRSNSLGYHNRKRLVWLWTFLVVYVDIAVMQQKFSNGCRGLLRSERFRCHDGGIESCPLHEYRSSPRICILMADTHSQPGRPCPVAFPGGFAGYVLSLRIYNGSRFCSRGQCARRFQDSSTLCRIACVSWEAADGIVFVASVWVSVAFCNWRFDQMFKSAM